MKNNEKHWKALIRDWKPRKTLENTEKNWKTLENCNTQKNTEKR